MRVAAGGVWQHWQRRGTHTHTHTGTGTGPPPPCVCVPQIPRGFIFNPTSAEVGERGLRGGVGGVLLAAAPMGGSTCGWEHPRVGADRVRSYSRGKKEDVFVSGTVPSAPGGEQSRGTARRGAGGHPSCRGAFTHPRPPWQAGTLLFGHRAPLHPHGAWGTHVAGCGARAAAMESVHPHPRPHSRPRDAAFLGAEQIFWRPPDNSALYLPPGAAKHTC